MIDTKWYGDSGYISEAHSGSEHTCSKCQYHSTYNSRDFCVYNMLQQNNPAQDPQYVSPCGSCNYFFHSKSPNSDFEGLKNYVAAKCESESDCVQNCSKCKYYAPYNFSHYCVRDMLQPDSEFKDPRRIAPNGVCDNFVRCNNWKDAKFNILKMYAVAKCK